MAQPLIRQILALNLITLVPVFAAVAWSAQQTYREQIRELQLEARSLAAAIVVYLDRDRERSRLQTVIRSIPLAAGRVIVVTDAKRRILASSGNDDYVGLPSDIGRPQDVPPFQIRRGLDDIERVYANVVVPAGPWFVSVGIPTAVASARTAPVLRRNLAIALGATWLTLLLDFLLLQPYKGAFERATAFALRVASGDLSQPKTTRMPSREMERLQNTLVTMVTKLRESTQAQAEQVAAERRMREELESLQRQIARQERLAAIGVLVSGVAHELNNPLQAILGSAELLQLRDDVSSASRSDLALIVKESARASTIIRNLSRFSRQQPHDPTPVKLREIVSSVVLLRKRWLDDREIHLDINCDGDPTVLAVYEELQQVVLNFVINAEQAVTEQPPPRRIAIDINNTPGRARLEVHDNGAGVPAEFEPKLFQPFFTTKPSGEGTGLGLSVSYGIVQSHGGTIGYQPSRLGGAMFFVELSALQGVGNT